MWNTPSKERLDKIPRLYETEHVPLKDKLIPLHFVIGGSDFFITEFDGEDIFFGFVILNNDLEMAEWGYSSFSELRAIKVNGWIEIDCELEDIWKIRKASEIEKIRIAQGWAESDDDIDQYPLPAVSSEVSHDERDEDHDKKKAYISSKGLMCPFCKAESVQGGFIQVGAGEAFQDMNCIECECRWQDVYQLVDVISQEEAQ